MSGTWDLSGKILNSLTSQNISGTAASFDALHNNLNIARKTVRIFVFA